MLFRKKINRSCAYCARGTQIGDEQVLCSKYGAVSIYYACRRFKYDACKRIPPKSKALDFRKYDSEDYSL